MKCLITRAACRAPGRTVAYKETRFVGVAGPRQPRAAAGTPAIQARADGPGAAACVALGGSTNGRVRRGAP